MEACQRFLPRWNLSPFLRYSVVLSRWLKDCPRHIHHCYPLRSHPNQLRDLLLRLTSVAVFQKRQLKIKEDREINTNYLLWELQILRACEWEMITERIVITHPFRLPPFWKKFLHIWYTGSPSVNQLVNEDRENLCRVWWERKFFSN